ncbi:MAG: GyrI-like domain-containing protein [Clostridiales bacterium]|jgi:hypothetical protein|nr:GyrI-like domain-containing protein [Clostridiales bacterium]
MKSVFMTARNTRRPGSVLGQDVHVGFIPAGAEVPAPAENDSGFTSLTLPASEYAVFDVYAANGYDSENAAMEKWLADNAAQITPRELGGKKYVVE